MVLQVDRAGLFAHGNRRARRGTGQRSLAVDRHVIQFTLMIGSLTFLPSAYSAAVKSMS